MKSKCWKHGEVEFVESANYNAYCPHCMTEAMRQAQEKPKISDERLRWLISQVEDYMRLSGGRGSLRIAWSDLLNSLEELQRRRFAEAIGIQASQPLSMGCHVDKPTCSICGEQSAAVVSGKAAETPPSKSYLQPAGFISQQDGLEEAEKGPEDE